MKRTGIDLPRRSWALFDRIFLAVYLQLYFLRALKLETVMEHQQVPEFCNPVNSSCFAFCHYECSMMICGLGRLLPHRCHAETFPLCQRKLGRRLRMANWRHVSLSSAPFRPTVPNASSYRRNNSSMNLPRYEIVSPATALATQPRCFHRCPSHRFQAALHDHLDRAMRSQQPPQFAES